MVENILNFMGNHPWLSIGLVFVVAGTVESLARGLVSLTRAIREDHCPKCQHCNPSKQTSTGADGTTSAKS